MAALTESELRELLGVWTARLGLGHWRLLLEVGGVDDASAYMETHRSAYYERAVIYVQPWLLGDGDAPQDVMIRGDRLTAEFVESTLVHELLHLHTRDMSAVVRDDLDGQMHRDAHTLAKEAMQRAEEQCVDRLAEALVRAFA